MPPFRLVVTCRTVRTPHRLIALLAACLLASCAQTQVDPGEPAMNSELELRAVAWDESRLDRLRDAMPELLRTHGVSGAAIGFVGDGRLQWAEGFGTSTAGVAISADSLFSAAGLREPVIAALTLALARQSSWSLHSPLTDVAPQAPDWGPVARLTPRQLLSHTAGLAARSTAPTPSYDAAPGAWQPSGAGYDLLVRTLEAGQNMPLPLLAAEQLFAAAGMSDSRFDAAGNLVTSARDYAKFLQWLLSPEREAATLATLLGVQTTVARQQGLYWGLGWGLERRADTGLTAFHWGADPRFVHLALLDPVRRRALVVLTNAENGLGLLADAVAILDEEPHTLFDFDTDGAEQ